MSGCIPAPRGDARRVGPGGNGEKCGSDMALKIAKAYRCVPLAYKIGGWLVAAQRLSGRSLLDDNHFEAQGRALR